MPLRLRPLLEPLSIRTKDIGEGYVKFPFDGEYAWVQVPYLAEIERQYNAGKPVRIIVLKARQLGISTATEGVMFNWMFLYPGCNGLIMANLSDTSTELFQMTKTYWEKWPLKQYAPPLKYDTKQHMRWQGINSALRVATAKNVAGGRGSTIHALHATEVAFYEDAKTLFNGLNQTIPTKHGTIVVLESTANGMGNYWHEQWDLAMQGGSDYVPMFFPYWKHPGYRLPTRLVIKSELTVDEKKLVLMGAPLEAIEWRRWAIPNLAGNDEQFFMQEYPGTPEEAFLTTGTPIFNALTIQSCSRITPGAKGHLIERPDGTIYFEPDPNGYLTLYVKPSKSPRPDRYFIGGDASMTLAGDYSCAQVIDRSNTEQVAVWRGKIDSTTFGEQMMLLGKFYNWAMLCPEVLGGGQATIGIIKYKNYPNIFVGNWPDKTTGGMQNIMGWQTNHNRKHYAVSVLKKHFVGRSITIHDTLTRHEAVNYIMRPDGTMGNSANSAHDDTISALSMAVAGSLMTGPYDAYAEDNPDGGLDLYGTG